LNELETRLDKWLYFIKHLEDFTTIPQLFNDVIFKIAFDKTALARYNALEINDYELSLKNYRDSHAVVSSAFKDGEIKGEVKGIEKGIVIGKKEGKKEGIAIGKEEGKKEGKKDTQIEMVKSAFSMSMSIENISQLTKLSEAEIKTILGI